GIYAEPDNTEATSLPLPGQHIRTGSVVEQIAIIQLQIPVKARIKLPRQQVLELAIIETQSKCCHVNSPAKESYSANQPPSRQGLPGNKIHQTIHDTLGILCTQIRMHRQTHHLGSSPVTHRQHRRSIRHRWQHIQWYGIVHRGGYARLLTICW